MLAYILCGCATLNIRDEIEETQQVFNNTTTIVVNADFIPDKNLYYEKLKAIDIELSDLKINWESMPKSSVQTKWENIKKQCFAINDLVQKDLKKKFEEKIARLENAPLQSDQRHIQYLHETLKILNKPELNPVELKNIVRTLKKVEEQKIEILTDISFGVGDHQLSIKGKKHLKSFYINNIESTINKISNENDNIPLVLNFSINILGYTDEIGFSPRSKKKLGKECGINFKNSRKETIKKLNRCLSKLRAQLIGEYFHSLQSKDSNKNINNDMLKTNFIIESVGKGEEMPDGLKDGSPRDKRRRICKIIFTYWKEAQTKTDDT